jgi:hypothetical protein
MATNIVEPTNDSVFGEDQENRICPNVVSIIRTQFLESTTVSDTMPSLQDQPRPNKG